MILSMSDERYSAQFHGESGRLSLLCDLLADHLQAIDRAKRPAEVSRLFFVATGHRLFTEAYRVVGDKAA